MRTFFIGDNELTLNDIEDILNGDIRAALSPRGRSRVKASRKVVQKAIQEKQTVYGVTTGFGPLSDTRIPSDKMLELQVNLIRSHALAVGIPLPIPETRLVLFLRAHSLARGFSGVTLDLLNAMMDAFNHDLLPVVYEGGSVGASGDLAPLALLGAALMGEWEVWFEGSRHPAAEGLRRAQLTPYAFREKEALSVINGTQLISSRLATAILDAQRLVRSADIVAALTLDALKGSVRAFDPRVAKVKPHPGMIAVCENVTRLMKGSEILKSHEGCKKVQDAYSLRCTPQVHGSVRDALEFASRVCLREVNSAVDNPLVFPEENEIISAGNFHGQSVAHAADTLVSALATLANISERRIERLTNPNLSELPPFLIKEGGLHSGFMVMQVAAAALAAECRTLAYPSSVTSIPTSAAKEDHVSMGPTSVRNLRRVVDNVATVLAIEMLSATQALDFLRPLKPGMGGRVVSTLVRDKVPPLEVDRSMTGDLESAQTLLTSGEVLGKVQAEVGGLA